jgi:hypothetical protein
MRRLFVTLIAVASLVAAAAVSFHAPPAIAQAPPASSPPPKPAPKPGEAQSQVQPPRPGEPKPGEAQGQQPPFVWNRARAETLMTAMLDHIKGKEDMPAESVYKNIKILKGMPAKRVAGIMTMGFSRSLGMSCRGCHVRNDFASDSIANKRIAREMWAMVQDINKNKLPAIKDIDVQMPMVNCWTCHRGQHEPETNADAPPKTGQEQPKPESSH